MDGRRVSGDSVPGREHAVLDFDIACLGLDVKMNADGALTRQLANKRSPGARGWKSILKRCGR
jgi:hypothetical protein